MAAARRWLSARVLCAFVALLLVACNISRPVGTPGVAQATAGGSGGINRAAHRDKPHLILISFDGFRPDYLDRFDLPNFRRVLARGARARAMIPVFPSLTFPNHYSLVTGLHPEHHGIIENSFYDPERKAAYSFRDGATVTDASWYRGEPVWVTAETQGMVAACFFWPGSEAAIKGVRPTFWKTYDGGIPNKARVDTVLDWLRLPPERRPHIITLYFSDIDAASHRGPLESSIIERAVRSLDGTLGALVDALDSLPIRDRIYLLLTSDHGMTETSGVQRIRLDSLIGTLRVRVGYSGPIAGLHVQGDSREAEAIRDAINARLKHGRAFLRLEVPARHHYRADPRIGDVVIIMDEPWVLETSLLSRALIQNRWGEHGWDPAAPSMHALFVIAGPGIQRGLTVPEVQNVDVYPLMIELLGLRAADGIDGRAGWIGRLVSVVR
jgi:predicted AlkP superfamily pyrophosphatase or phosphodiesterase